MKTNKDKKELKFRIVLDSQINFNELNKVIVGIETLGYIASVSKINGDIGFYK